MPLFVLYDHNQDNTFQDAVSFQTICFLDYKNYESYMTHNFHLLIYMAYGLLTILR
uniref:Uncharacterized protein n=1 Tax=uncultured marine virus TaxID=186617 RepID=A0A0F7L6W8_9VIRU|nr:hypothetical protein [uncultured marine virus]